MDVYFEKGVVQVFRPCRTLSPRCKIGSEWRFWSKWAPQIGCWDYETKYCVQKFNVLTARFDATVLKIQQGGEGGMQERLEFQLFEGGLDDGNDWTLKGLFWGWGGGALTPHPTLRKGPGPPRACRHAKPHQCEERLHKVPPTTKKNKRALWFHSWLSDAGWMAAKSGSLPWTACLSMASPRRWVWLEMRFRKEVFLGEGDNLLPTSRTIATYLYEQFVCACVRREGSHGGSVQG